MATSSFFSKALIISSSFLLIINLRFCSADSSNLQDYCPTATTSSPPSTFMNGFPCKNPSNITAADFKNDHFGKKGDTSNLLRSSVRIVTANEFPGLNTLGLSTSRTDMDVDGLVSPHYHPRASEIMFVVKGTVIVGFVDTSNNVFQKIVREGDVFIVPRGMFHYCFNTGFEEATLLSVLSSQNPGVVGIDDSTVTGGADPESARRLTTRLVSLSGLDSSWVEESASIPKTNSLSGAASFVI